MSAGPVRWALTPSRRFDRDAHGRPGPPVGDDVWEIVGHTVVGDTVYLTLKPLGWVRNTDALLARRRHGAAEDR